MEHFNSLPSEKQTIVINAALMSFGANGYKKTSIADIAREANISKALVFHYFGSKKNLYLYLIEYCRDKLVGAIKDSRVAETGEFFDRIIASMNVQLRIVKENPYILLFLRSMYSETDKQVYGEIQGYLAQIGETQTQMIVNESDAEKFKEGIDPQFVLKMLTWMGEGFMNEIIGKTAQEIDLAAETLFRSISILKRNLLKEEK